MTLSAPTSATRQHPRLIQLDVLRGIAVLLVLGAHSILTPAQAGLLKVPTTLWHRFGWTGVDLFFVLSGFLVGGLLMQEYKRCGNLHISRFLIRRGFKIWPSYYVYLFVTAYLCCPLLGRPVPTLTELWPGIANLQNYLGTPFGHTWSLGVEEHFYLLLPLLLAALWRFSPHAIRWTPWVLASLIFAIIVARIVSLYGVPFGNRTHQWPTHLRADGLLFGVLLSYFHHFHLDACQRFARRKSLLLFISALLLLPMFKLPLGERPFVYLFGYTLIYLAYGLILLVALYTPPSSSGLGKLFANPIATAVAFVGTYSYSIYLWHIEYSMFPWRKIAESHLVTSLPPELQWILTQSGYVLTCVVVGVIFGKLIEMPALHFRDRLLPSRSANGQSPAGEAFTGLHIPQPELSSPLPGSAT